MAVKPTKRQLEYQDWELGVFVHFGIRTFHEGHRDWDGNENDMKAENFNPSSLDCEQWARSAAEGGAKYMVLTAKHHDGFANWPSKYTNFSVASSPWKNGKGDVVREYVDACHKHGLKVGLYYSPADATSPLYDDPQAYDDYFIDQISELLDGSYDSIDMLWFDGCGSENHEYDWKRITAEIRRMQPEILLFNMGDPDYRWIGNENGYAGMPHWNATSKLNFSIQTDRVDESGGELWLPGECDMRMRDINWFYSEKDECTVKSREELLGVYYYSIGRGCNMLINIGPDRRGLLPDADANALKSMWKEVSRRFSEPIATMSDFSRTDNFWTLSREVSHNDGIMGNYMPIDHAIIQEDLSMGENIRRFRIKVTSPGVPQEITIYEGYNIGHKAICRFPLIRCNSITLEVLEASSPIKLRTIEFYNSGA